MYNKNSASINQERDTSSSSRNSSSSLYLICGSSSPCYNDASYPKIFQGLHRDARIEAPEMNYTGRICSTRSVGILVHL